MSPDSTVRFLGIDFTGEYGLGAGYAAYRCQEYARLGVALQGADVVCAHAPIRNGPEMIRRLR